MDNTESIIGYLKQYPETYAGLYKFLSDQFKVQVTEEQLMKLKLGMLVWQLIPYVESRGADMLDVLFFADYQKPDYTFLQLQAYSIVLIFHRLEKKQPLIFLVF